MAVIGLLSVARAQFSDLVTQDQSAPEPTDPDRERNGDRSALFRCPSCELVFVAVEKEQCSHCESQVTKIEETGNRGEQPPLNDPR